MTLLPYVVAITLGAVIGSFLNVCIYRLPRKESVAWPASHCPSCGGAIAAYDNLPLLSYLILRGRCRQCRAGISPRYPLVEAANAVGYGLILWWFGPGWPAGVYCALFSTLLLVTVIDLAHQIIPDVITLPGIPIGLVSAATVLPITLVDSILGAVVGGGLLWLMAWISPYLFGKEGMGGGDIKLLAMVGTVLGWKPTLLTILVGSLAGAVVGIALIALGLLRRNQYVPFGPFLALGAVVSLFFHQDLFRWYAGFFQP